MNEKKWSVLVLLEVRLSYPENSVGREISLGVAGRYTVVEHTLRLVLERKRQVLLEDRL